MSGYAPYDDLHIYLIDGQVSERDEAGLGESFLGNWVDDNNSFLFFSEPVKGQIEDLLKDRSDLVLIEEYHLPYEQWQGGVSEPVKIGCFVIVPPWVEVSREPGEIQMILDPGVVFGTGLHPTTKDCLRALIYLRETQLPMNKVLDLGTGTGILALAAGFLGAGDVTAVDLNPLAAKTAKRNVLLNHFEGSIKVVEGQAQDFADRPADLVMANIHHAVIKRLFQTKDFQGKKSYIISGLMRSQVRDLKVELQNNGLEVIQEWDYEMTWYTLLLTRS